MYDDRWTKNGAGDGDEDDGPVVNVTRIPKRADGYKNPILL